MTKRRLVEHKPAAKLPSATNKPRAKAPSRARKPKAEVLPADALPARDYVDHSISGASDDSIFARDSQESGGIEEAGSFDDAAGDETAFVDKGAGSKTKLTQGRGKGAAASSSALGARAAVAMVQGKGSAVDAVLSAFFAEAGNDPSVLFSPVSALVFGGGAGVRAFDGRLRQPGLGAARPRGARDGDAVIDASRVAAPRSVATAILLHTLYGRTSLSEVTRQGASDAKVIGAVLRSKLLQRIGAAGGAALSKSEILGAILAVAGVSVGGTLTEEDILDALPGGTSISPSAHFGDAKMYRVPWGSQVAQDKTKSDGAPTTEVITACDSWGLVALLSFERGRGLMVPELEVSLPLSGIPVRRGVTRTSPGTVLPSPSPLVVIDRGPDLRVAFGARVTPDARVRVVTPADIEPIAVTTPVDNGVREVARRMAATVAVVALEARGARAITASDAAA